MRIAALGIVNQKEKPQGIGLAHDHQSCIEDGSQAYCHGADGRNIVHNLLNVKNLYL